MVLFNILIEEKKQRIALTVRKVFNTKWTFKIFFFYESLSKTEVLSLSISNRICISFLVVLIFYSSHNNKFRGICFHSILLFSNIFRGFEMKLQVR
ncbi:hypothetical protein LEP1GSC175_2117 [Leptospira santarosai str. HAI821]|nr:hypothetical protein LEP1GSC175_2117 [Leptospira santarosai str. HAI821]